MTQKDLNMIKGTEEEFKAARNAIGVILKALPTISGMAEGKDVQSLAMEAMDQVIMAETHLLKAEEILNGQTTDEPTMLDMFMRAQETLHDLGEYVANEYASTDDEGMFAELDTANHLISDAVEIINRAKFRAEGHLKDRKTARVILQTMGEYFTADHTTPELRFTGIPEEYRK